MSLAFRIVLVMVLVVGWAATATAVTPADECDQGLLLFYEPCNSALLFVAGF